MNKTIIFFGLFFWAPCLLARVELYSGEAKRDGKVVYIEKHSVTYDDVSGRVLESQTEYRSASDVLLATLKSNFSKSLTSPDHVFTDLRDGSIHGVRNFDKKKVLFSQEKNKPEKTEEIEVDTKKEDVTFGCQGLNYYILQNASSIKEGQSIPITFLIPGKLDSYSFELNYTKKNPDGTLDVEIEIESFFLKIFAPKLYVKYDLNKKRILHYKGLSNLNDDKGSTQNVEITYSYPN